MARNKQKRINKIRKYRDKLLVRITQLEGKIRMYKDILQQTLGALRDDNILRAIALARYEDVETSNIMGKFFETNEIANELALVYKFLIVERQYAEDIQKSAVNRDYLRVAALCSTYKDEIAAHEKILSEWTQDHGFKRSLLRSMNDEDIA